MSHIYDLSNVNLKQPSVLTIGVFDGVHRGHQHLIKRLVAEAHAQNMLAVVMTFFPHPDRVIHGQQGRYYLMKPDEKAQYLLGLGIDVVITHHFDEQARQVRALTFVEQLIHHLQLKHLWVGADFGFGFKREGNVPFLIEQGQVRGFEVTVVDMVSSDERHENISSTLIRELIQTGKMEDTRKLLGRGYSLSGEVIHGKKLGRTIGFPTANIDVWDEQIMPLFGVYTGWAYLGNERFMAMTNVGISPTVDYKGVTVEAYLLDFDRDIYGETLTITFEHFLRPEAKFNGLDELIIQIKQDVEDGRDYLINLEAEL
jgi:riboflavin kinase/FMN adenylyltransferase